MQDFGICLASHEARDFRISGFVIVVSFDDPRFKTGCACSVLS